MSKAHPQQWTIHDDDHRPSAASVAALAQYPTTQIADSGGPVSVVGPGIVHQAGGRDFCGPALTVWTKPGDILFLLKAPDLAREGDVLVVDGGGRPDAAILGDIMSGALARIGAVGIAIDGVVRDVDGIDEIGLPVFARGVYPTTGSNEGPGAINVDVVLGGVAVHPGDVVRGDASGLVVVPREHVDDVVALTRAVDERERTWTAAMRDGAGLAEATGVDEVIRQRREAVGVHLP
ncbi:RraA family protein [Actinomycetospora termitidis]|uniref:Putative 4-hydroxy-4-methyl-2-oxoglutarate aldolase n=1 Tax=Actinomycetospora termitidis TaxID=3053470 RepID=A0ABT7MIZ9_9PSEU|nr:dimethylmenaquinone methyltransferase [Actinomycetospora sp. Odt1-22]MDL5159887.1 dimethylmenaquinone methyltransferase [Actinomycetospora sp. Odt1-22]